MGRALKFYASVRLDVRRIEAIKQGGEVIGNRTRAKVVKNKIAPPFKEAMVDIIYGEGISQYGELVDMGAEKDIIDKAGSWYSYGDHRIGQGRESAKTYLKDNPEIFEEVDKRVRAAYGIGEPFEMPEESADVENEDEVELDLETEETEE